MDLVYEVVRPKLGALFLRLAHRNLGFEFDHTHDRDKTVLFLHRSSLYRVIKRPRYASRLTYASMRF